MYLFRSLALAGCLLIYRVGGWDRKEDYYADPDCGEHSDRLKTLKNADDLKQCHSSPNPKGPEGEENCKKYLQERSTHLCGEPNDILHCHTGGDALCCYNNSNCMQDVLDITPWNERMRRANERAEEKKREKEMEKKKSQKTSKEKTKRRRKCSRNKVNYKVFG